MKKKVVFFGTPDFVTPVLQKLFEHFEVVAIVTSPDAIQGRKKELTPSPVKQYVLKSNVNTAILSPEKLDNQIAQELQELSPDLFIVAAYGKIIPQQILDIPQFGSLNIHPSLLPKYRGPSPIQTALLNGDTVSGISVIEMDAEMDHGPIVAKWEYPLTSKDTFESLHYAMFQEASEKLSEIITNFCSKKTPGTVQDESLATYCQRITREDGFVDFASSPDPVELDRKIRAFYPWPNVWTRLDGKIVKLYPEKKIQVEGKGIVTVKDFLNGYPKFRQLLESVLLLER